MSNFSNRDKALRLGEEIELKNVGVKISTARARDIFLVLIAHVKPYVVLHLLRLSNDSAENIVADEQKGDELSLPCPPLLLFIDYLLINKPELLNLRVKHKEKWTPVNDSDPGVIEARNYFESRRKKKFNDGTDDQPSREKLGDKLACIQALDEFIPNWLSLKSHPEAQSLCEMV